MPKRTTAHKGHSLRINHKGRSIFINDDPVTPEVHVNGQRIVVSKSPAGYWTPHDAYRRFDTLDKLAHAVAEKIENRKRSE